MNKIVNKLKEYISKDFYVETIIDDLVCSFILKKNDNTYTFDVIKSYSLDGKKDINYYFNFSDYHTLLYFNKIFLINFDFVNIYRKAYNTISFLHYYIFGKSIKMLTYPEKIEDLIQEFDDRYFLESYFVDDFKSHISSYKLKLELDIIFSNDSNIIELEFLINFKHNNIINKIIFKPDQIQEFVKSYLEIHTKNIIDKDIYDLDFNDMKLLHMIKYN